MSSSDSPPSPEVAIRAAGAQERLTDTDTIDKIECGRDAAKHFLFGKGYKNLNHGSFGTFPVEIRSVARHYQELCEARPDKFIRYQFPEWLDDSRQAVAKYTNAPVEACVFVTNATTGINTVLRNLVYEPGDVIIYFATIYGACNKTIEYITESTPAESRKVEYTYPCSDEVICNGFEQAIEAIKADGKNPRIALFDTIASLPGVRMPFEDLTSLCRKHGILSCIDGAHSIGQIPMDLGTLDPDFYVSNCHKWLHVPRACAIFYVPVRNQHLMRSSLPTSHGFVPRTDKVIVNPLPPSTKGEFITQFMSVGTMDNSPYLCVPASLQWRSKVTYNDLRGEEAVMRYCIDVARTGGDAAAKILGTEVMENEQGTLRRCAFANVRLPLSYQDDAGGDYAIAVKIAQWIAKLLVNEYDTFLAIFFHGGMFWARLSGQIYLTTEDFEWGGEVMKEVCERAKKREWQV